MSSLSTRKLSYRAIKTLQKISCVGPFVRFAQLHFTPTGRRESGKNNSARCAFISDRLAVGWLAGLHGHIQIDPGRRKSWSLFFHSFSVWRARAISLRALFPQRTTFSLLHIQPAGEIFSGYCSSLVFFSLSPSTLHSWQKRISMKFVSCCYFRHDVDFSIDFPGKDIEPRSAY